MSCTDAPARPVVRNLVFDFGGVLFRWQPAALFAQHFPQHADTPERAAQLARAMFHHPDWEAFDGGTSTLEDAVLRGAARLNLPHAPLNALVGSIGEHLVPIPETVAMLQRLHQRRQSAPAGEPGLKLYFLSNMPAPYARQLERKHAFLSCFDGGVFSGDVRLIKPHAAIYAHLQQRHGLQPAQTLFVDDYAANVEAARAQGWHSVRFESAAQFAADLRRYGIHTD